MLRQLEGNLWVLDKPFRIPGAELGVRMTVVRLKNGDLWVHSPVRTTPEERGAIDGLGRVAHIVAPSKVHHLFAAELRACYPEAKLYVAPGLAQKNRALVASEPLTERPPSAWGGEIDQIPLSGAPAISETVFRYGRTLIVTDLVFNYVSAESFGTKLFLTLDGALGGLRASRLLRLCIKDKAAARASIERILAWDFDSIIVCHGEVLSTGGRDELRRAFRFLLSS
jgi:hypothetical protein